MLNLYWKTKDQTRNLLSKPFKSEAEFESYIYKNHDLLGDVYILYRQIHTGNKQGIPDMLGVDKDSRICIIEMKNTEVGEEILPQVLGYAMWAETNPDSIKAIWLESKVQPEDVQLDWDSLEIRIIVVAPSFRPNVLRMAAKIGYQVDLIQVQRFGFEEEEFTLVETLENIPVGKVITTKAKGDWSWEYYETEHDKKAVSQFRQAVEDLDALVRKKGWNLPFNINKYYTGFKLGSKVVFSVSWQGIHAWKINIKLPETVAKDFKGKDWEFQRYDEQFGEAIFRSSQKDKVDITELESLLTLAYKRISGVD